MRKVGALVAGGLCMIAPPAIAQQEDRQFWSTMAAGVRLSDTVSLQGEVVLRFGDAGLYESEAGGFVTYRLSESVSLSAGYARVTNYTHGQVTRSEDRPRQQIDVDLGTILGGELNSRLRFEQRFRNSDTGFRLRPRVKWKLPWRERGGPALVLSHESFVELNDTDGGQNAGYRRMRNFAGVDVPIAGSVRAEIGYLNQYDLRDRARDTMDHILSIGVGAKF
ncbi:DUF2490 domain-containing protein [Stakelama tenebrarum]|uniref:DUF2490 domain-containing protein n=1 Tax=Stakelama tenebrarum TaxID=2711215 RepID=A0A6G6Y381_9SPHN|nr:DUF2490 domain-containing protein [Sphingosinithalassobacter tenebrarum]QIG79267.1 DUF2490 domain-containing protein [Sphingosinithalassobacter tenebrarum]